jgi:hypothetical protein
LTFISLLVYKSSYLNIKYQKRRYTLVCNAACFCPTKVLFPTEGLLEAGVEQDLLARDGEVVVAGGDEGAWIFPVCCKAYVASGSFAKIETFVDAVASVKFNDIEARGCILS